MWFHPFCLHWYQSLVFYRDFSQLLIRQELTGISEAFSRIESFEKKISIWGQKLRNRCLQNILSLKESASISWYQHREFTLLFILNKSAWTWKSRTLKMKDCLCLYLFQRIFLYISCYLFMGGMYLLDEKTWPISFMIFHVPVILWWWCTFHSCACSGWQMV